MVKALCMSTRAESCGRPDHEDALQHAYERAAALGQRQRVTIQSGSLSGHAYYVIRSVCSA